MKLLEYLHPELEVLNISVRKTESLGKFKSLLSAFVFTIHDPIGIKL